MNTFLYSYLVVMIVATIFLCYVHRAKIVKALKWFYKELQETGANAGNALRQ